MKKLALFSFALLSFVVANGSEAQAALSSASAYFQEEDGTPVAFFDADGSWSYAPEAVFGTTTEDESGQHVLPISASAGSDAEYFYLGIASAATYSFAAPQDGFSFFWGTVDSYNSIKIAYSDGHFETLDGAEVLLLAADGFHSDGPLYIEGSDEGVYVTLSGVLGETLKSITFINGSQNAFEFSGVASVPLPGALVLFGSALVGAGVFRRKKLAA